MKKLTTPSFQKDAYMGLIVLVVFGGIFLLWGFLASLESASIASGKVAIEAQKKAVQHPHGGRIETILVEEGDEVVKGQVLLTLDATQAKADYDQLAQRFFYLLAQRVRLKIEANEGEIFEILPEAANYLPNPILKEALEIQQGLFYASKLAYEGKQAILQSRADQLTESLKSFEKQIISVEEQQRLLNEEIAVITELEEQSLVPRSRVFNLKREAANLVERREIFIGQKNTAEKELKDALLQEEFETRNRKKEIYEKLTEVTTQLGESREQWLAAKDVLEKTQIKSPIDGTVVGLTVFTEGGVISPRDTIMEIVPSHGDLVIEASVNPLDIDIVRPGLKAKIQLVAYKQRNMPFIEGKVFHVSADSFTDPNSNESYYLAKVAIPREELEKVEGLQLYPGMPVMVMIITDNRSPFNYLFTPVKSSFNRAFREE